MYCPCYDVEFRAVSITWMTQEDRNDDDSDDSRLSLCDVKRLNLTF